MIAKSEKEKKQFGVDSIIIISISFVFLYVCITSLPMFIQLPKAIYKYENSFSIGLSIMFLFTAGAVVAAKKEKMALLWSAFIGAIIGFLFVPLMTSLMVIIGATSAMAPVLELAKGVGTTMLQSILISFLGGLSIVSYKFLRTRT